ncbi:MAG TPA: GNAT family protein [Pilimelia sp.]|nr:GNAT family protein [Pilimelia sp.]
MLTGDRVLLRAVERDDLPRLWEQYNDLEVEHRASDSRPLPTSLSRLQTIFDNRASEGESDKSRFVIEIADEVIGECTLHFFDTYSQACHLGISIRRDKWGQGYGQDAVRTLVRYAFGPLNFRKVSLEVLADDERAIRAYSKAGFQEEGRFRAHTWHDGQYRDVLRMAVLRP